MATISKIHRRVIISGQTRPLREQALESLPDTEGSRQFRELFSQTPIPQNRFWEDTRETYNQLMQGLRDTGAHHAEVIQRYVNDPDKQKGFVKAERVPSLITAYAEQHVALVEELENIGQAHLCFSGGTKNPDEHTHLLKVGELYAEFTEKLQTTLPPIAQEILESIGYVDDQIKLAEARKQDAVAGIEPIQEKSC